MFQATEFCSPVSTECYNNISAADAVSSSCKIPCIGLFADVQYVENEEWQEKKMEEIIKEYRKYQAQFGKDLVFDPEEQSLGKY